MNELVSVVVPIYKVEKYLNRCISSIVLQIYQNLEIILVDDGSTDNCYKICDEYAQKDSRLIVIHKPNGGVCSARNATLEIANWKYITFCDGDDYYCDDWIKSLYTTIQKEQVNLVMGNYLNVE